MITTNRLTRKFENRTAVDNLNLAIEMGEIFGLLGPNGAGKTTTVRMLTTLLQPTGGNALVAGFDIARQSIEVRRSIGYSPQEINLDRDLSGLQNLILHGLLHGMHRPEKKCHELLTWAGIGDWSHEIVRTYSGGMQRRLQIARSIMHHPKILFLDEPTVGLDPQIRRIIWEFIRTLNSKGIGVLLTTHYIEEAEMLCSRVGIMNKGKLIACDTPAQLMTTVGKVVVETKNNTGTDYRHFPDKESAYSYIQKLEHKKIRIRPATLEDVFIHYAGEEFAS